MRNELQHSISKRKKRILNYIEKKMHTQKGLITLGQPINVYNMNFTIEESYTQKKLQHPFSALIYDIHCLVVQHPIRTMEG